jgi:hypothetical protein
MGCPPPESVAVAYPLVHNHFLLNHSSRAHDGRDRLGRNVHSLQSGVDDGTRPNAFRSPAAERRRVGHCRDLAAGLGAIHGHARSCAAAGQARRRKAERGLWRPDLALRKASRPSSGTLAAQGNRGQYVASSFLRAALSWSGAASMETAPALRSTRSPRTR